MSAARKLTPQDQELFDKIMKLESEIAAIRAAVSLEYVSDYDSPYLDLFAASRAMIDAARVVAGMERS